LNHRGPCETANWFALNLKLMCDSSIWILRPRPPCEYAINSD
jgi:hypothetical protein